LRLFSFGGYGLALAALALVVFGAYDSYPKRCTRQGRSDAPYLSKRQGCSGTRAKIAISACIVAAHCIPRGHPPESHVVRELRHLQLIHRQIARIHVLAGWYFTQLLHTAVCHHL